MIGSDDSDSTDDFHDTHLFYFAPMAINPILYLQQVETHDIFLLRHIYECWEINVTRRENRMNLMTFACPFYFSA